MTTDMLAVAITGAISARLGEARITAAVLRLVIGGGLAMTVTYAIGG